MLSGTASSYSIVATCHCFLSYPCTCSPSHGSAWLSAVQDSVQLDSCCIIIFDNIIFLTNQDIVGTRSYSIMSDPDTCMAPVGSRFSTPHSILIWLIAVSIQLQSSLSDRVGHAFFSKERNILAIFWFFFKRTLHSRLLLRSLYKRKLHSLRSFTFFIKERCILCVLLCSL